VGELVLVPQPLDLVAGGGGERGGSGEPLGGATPLGWQRAPRDLVEPLVGVLVATEAQQGGLVGALQAQSLDHCDRAAVGIGHGDVGGQGLGPVGRPRPST